MRRFGTLRVYLRVLLPAHRIVWLKDPMEYDVLPLWWQATSSEDR
jgi:hypothetical protein